MEAMKVMKKPAAMNSWKAVNSVGRADANDLAAALGQLPQLTTLTLTPPAPKTLQWRWGSCPN